MDAAKHSKIIRFPHRHRIAKWIAPDLIWNPDMSLELDHWIDAYEAACIEIERLQSLVGASTHSEVRHD